MSKELVGRVLGIVLTAVVALLAVFGYDVAVIQPRVEVIVAQTGIPGLASRVVATNFTDLVIENSLVVAGTRMPLPTATPAPTVVPAIISASQTYSVYVALLTQTDTDAPVATVLENTLGWSVVWTRIDVGVYAAANAISGQFGPAGSPYNPDKVWISISDNQQVGNTPRLVWSYYTTAGNPLRFNVRSFSEGEEDQFIRMMIEIRVYP